MVRLPIHPLLLVLWGEPTAEFIWDAPSGCPTAEEQSAALADKLDGSLPRRRVTVISRVRREDEGWSLRLWTVAPGGTAERQISAADCTRLADVAVLLAAMAFDPDIPDDGDDVPTFSEFEIEQALVKDSSVEKPPIEESTTEEPTVEEPTVEELAVTESAVESHVIEPEVAVAESSDIEPNTKPSSSRTRRFRLTMRIATGVAIADLPRPGPVVRVALAAQWRSARLEVEGEFDPRRSVVGEEGRWVDYRQAIAIARGCWVAHYRKTRLESPVCAGLEFGATQAVGHMPPISRTVWNPWLAIDAALGLVWLPMSSLALGVFLEPWVSLRRAQFVTIFRNDESPSEIVWRTPPAGIRATAGVEFRF